MNHGRARLGVVVLAAAAGLAVSACGSSSSSKSDSSASSGGGSGKTPYVLGVIASESGPIASTIGQMGPTIEAWGKWKNATGGIDGHPVKVTVVDDAGNPATALSAVKKMVLQDKIIALISVSGSETSYAAYTKAQKIPIVGGLSVSQLYVTNGNYFTQGASPPAASYASLKATKDAGHDKLAIMYCSEVAACSEVVKATRTIGGPLGVKIVSSTAISSSAADYTAACLAAKKAGADALYVSAAAQQQLNVATSCAKQGLVAPLVTGAINFNNSWPKVSASNGAVSSVPVFPFTDDSTPATKAFQAAIDKYMPQIRNSDAWGESIASAWTSAELFAAAAKAGDLGDDPSAAGIFKGLYALKDETLGGLTIPLNFVQGDNPNAKNSCAFMMKIEGGKFTEPQGLNTICQS